MPSCPACLAPVPDAATFCPKCGKPITLVPESEKKTSGMAIAALILALIPTCLTQVVGIILGIVALTQISKEPRLKGKGLAIASIVIAPVLCFVMLMAAIAIPNFIKFQSRAKQSEPRMVLRSIHTSVKMYEAEKNEPPKDFAEMQFRAEPTNRYTYFYRQDVLVPGRDGRKEIPAGLLNDPNVKGAEAIAVGNIDSDPTLDVWTISPEGTLEHVQDDVSR